jgi:hypothetical protein
MHLNFKILAKPFRYPDAPRFCALPTVSRASCDCKLNCQVFDKERQLLGLSQFFFKVNDMQDDFSWRSPRVSGMAKVNDNRFLEGENLAFIGYGVVGAA